MWNILYSMTIIFQFDYFIWGWTICIFHTKCINNVLFIDLDVIFSDIVVQWGCFFVNVVFFNIRYTEFMF